MINYRHLSTETIAFLCLVLVIFIIDIVTPKSISVGIIYSLPVASVMFLSNNKSDILLTSLLCVIFSTLGFFASVGSIEIITTINRILSLIIISLIYILCDYFKITYGRKVFFDERFAAIIEAVQIPMLMVNTSGNIMTSNQAVRDLLEYNDKEINLLNSEELFPLSARHTHIQQRETYIKKTNKRIICNEKGLFCLSKTGKSIPIKLNINPIESNGEVYIITTIIEVGHDRDFF